MPAPQGKRIRQLQQKLSREGLDAFVVLDRNNTVYLTDFHCSASILVIDRHRATFITDSRYGEAATKALSSFCEVIIEPSRDVRKFLRALFRERAYGQVGFEGSISMNQFDSIKEIRIGRRFVKAGQLPGELRIVKDPTEMVSIKKAVRLADRMMKHAISLLRPGVSEAEISRAIRFASEEMGGEGESFPNIVASGPNSSRPHHHPGRRKIKTGDPVTIDLGAIVDGYCSDLTRTVVIGKVDPLFREIYGVCLKANKAAIDGLRPGMTGVEVDAIARGIIDEAGYGKYFGHGLGHGVGIEIHEPPRLSPGAGDYKLQPGNIVTIEPGIYLPGKFGVRIEDYALVTKNGAEVLSKAPKSLKVLTV